MCVCRSRDRILIWKQLLLGSICSMAIHTHREFVTRPNTQRMARRAGIQCGERSGSYIERRKLDNQKDVDNTHKLRRKLWTWRFQMFFFSLQYTTLLLYNPPLSQLYVYTGGPETWCFHTQQKRKNKLNGIITYFLLPPATEGSTTNVDPIKICPVYKERERKNW